MTARGVLALAATLIVLVAAVIGLGVANPVPRSMIGTDRLGPSTGDTVDDYVEAASASLSGGDGDPRWALVSLTESLTTQQLADSLGGVRVSTVYVNVPIDRVQTQVIPVAVSANPIALARTVTSAVGAVRAGSTERAGDVAELTRTRLLDDCACVAAVLVRADLDELRTVAASSVVRSVEALPPDAVYGSFAVDPLLPQQSGVVAPVADDGDVPLR